MYKCGDKVKVYGQIVEIDDISKDSHTHNIRLLYLSECIVVPGKDFTRDWCYPYEVQEHYPNIEE